MNAPLNLTNTANPFDVWFAPHAQLAGLSMMDHLFNRLDGAYPHKWRSNFPGQDAIDNWKTSWAEAFHDEGIAPADIKAGLKACRTRFDWPPSCAEFMKACRLPIDKMAAYYEAAAGVQARSKGDMGRWSHPAIFWAAMPMAFDLGAQTYSQIKGRWEQALDEQMDRGEWASIPAPMVALPAPGRADLSREKAAKMLNELGASGLLKPKTEHLRWANKILDREKRGDKSLLSIQVRMAREAMGA
jgi:hypothetical protein